MRKLFVLVNRTKSNSVVVTVFCRYRAKDAKAREIFEKVFPEIKKQREDKERLQRFVFILGDG